MKKTLPVLFLISIQTCFSAEQRQSRNWLARLLCCGPQRHQHESVVSEIRHIVSSYQRDEMARIADQIDDENDCYDQLNCKIHHQRAQTRRSTIPVRDESVYSLFPLPEFQDKTLWDYRRNIRTRLQVENRDVSRKQPLHRGGSDYSLNSNTSSGDIQTTDI